MTVSAVKSTLNRLIISCLLIALHSQAQVFTVRKKGNTFG